MIELLKNRRAWVAIVGIITSLAQIFGIEVGYNTETLADLLTTAGTAVASLVMAGLSIWSLVKPKPAQKKK